MSLLLALACAEEPQPEPSVEDTAHVYIPCSEEPYVNVEVGYASGCALRADGCLDCWVGPKPISYWTDYSVESPPGGAFSSVSVSDSTLTSPCASDDESYPSIGACGLTAEDQLKCWGRWDADSRLPDGPQSQVSVGYTHACALDQEGRATCWGACDYGECDVPGGTYTSIVAAESFSCGLLGDGRAECWGVNPSFNCTCYGNTDCWTKRTELFDRWAAGPYEELLTAWTVLCGRYGSTLTCIDYYGDDDGDSDDLEDPLQVTLADGAIPGYVQLGMEFLSEVCGLDATGTLVCESLEDAPSGSQPYVGRVLRGVDAAGEVCAVTEDGELECSYSVEWNAFCPFCSQIWIY